MKTRKNNGISVRLLVMILALTLIVGGIVGGSVAWLTATTPAVTNTFTYGDIEIELEETPVSGGKYKVTPGVDIEKDPTVTVLADSEDCWLFVEIVENNWPAFTESDGITRKVNYSIDSGWTKLQSGVYYREVSSNTSDQEFSVLTNNEVTVSENLTKSEIKNAGDFTLTITAYAVQKDSNIATAAAAWEIANPTT